MKINRFELHRKEDETGVSGTGAVAEGVRFTDGTIVLRWTTAQAPHSTAVYQSLADLVKIHGHDGKTRVVWYERTPHDDLRDRARIDFMQDDMENCPFASVGGPDNVEIENLCAPKYIKQEQADEYVQAYRDYALTRHGRMIGGEK